MKNKSVYKIPIQIDGRHVSNMWVAHGTSDSTIASVAMSNMAVQLLLGDDTVLESISAVPYQPVNIITKQTEETDHD